MKVGIPKEVKDHEYRVAITPIGVHELVAHGHEVVIQQGAGVGSGRRQGNAVLVVLDFLGHTDAHPTLLREAGSLDSEECG